MLKKIGRKARTFVREAADMGLRSAGSLMIDRLSWKWDPKPGARGVASVRPKYLPHPVHYRRHTSDSWAIEMVLTGREYGDVVLAEPPKVIVDCGANIGCASLYLLHRYPDARVVAIEPDRDNFEMCRRNLEVFGDRVTLLQAAVWPDDTGLDVVRGEYLSGWEWAHQVRPAKDAEKAEVRGISMGSLFDQIGAPRIDLLKIDIEGAEMQLFVPDCDAWLSRVNNICIELHGAEAEALFIRRMSSFDYERSTAGELTVCSNVKLRSDKLPATSRPPMC